MPSLLEALQRKYFTDYNRDNNHQVMVKTVSKGTNNNNNSNCNGSNGNTSNGSYSNRNSNSNNSNNSHSHSHSHSKSQSQSQSQNQSDNKIHNNNNNNNNNNDHNKHEPSGMIENKDENVEKIDTEAETEMESVAVTAATKLIPDSVAEFEPETLTEANRLISIFVPRIPPLVCVPQLLVLNDCDIDCAGNFDSIRDKCRSVRELDLAQNKLHDWNEIFQIIQHMPQIEFLNLSHNHLSGSLIRTPNIMPIQNLRGIVLNGTYLNWESIKILLKNLPILAELHLSLNNYNEISLDLTADDDDDDDNDDDDNQLNCAKHFLPHKALKILHFTSNPIDKWSEICRLGRIFPNLEKLLLAKCPLTSLICNKNHHDDRSCNTERNSMNSDCDASGDGIMGGGDMEGTDTHNETGENIFQNLQYLNLNCTSIDKWENVDYLANYPKLNTLWVKNWPLWDQLECTEHERRQLLIARLPNVQILNGGGIITADEREDAERSFIRYYMDKSEMGRPQKRFMDLIAKHGELKPLVNINLKPDKRIKIFLTYNDKREARMVDVYRTVGDLKVKLERIVGLAANQLRLYYVDQDYKDFGPEEMRFPNKYLYSYNIQPGDEIIVDVKKKKKISTSESDQQI